MRVAVLGATGHTGALAVRALRDRGADVLACGRSEAALGRLRDEGFATARVDVGRPQEVRAALEGADLVANLAGPFLATGHVPIEEALRRGIPYADTTGEQAFMLASKARHHAAATEAGVPLVHALAYEYALSDLVVGAHFAQGGDALHVFYRPRGARASAATKKSIARVLGAPCWGFEEGALVRVPPARFVRRFMTDQGPRDAASFAAGEPVTVPWHAPFRTVRGYVGASPAVARALRLASPLFRATLRGGVLRAVERRIDRAHEPPRNEDVRAEVHVVSERPDRRALIAMGDPYVVTAELLAEGLLRLPSSKTAGVVAPTQALDAASVLRALANRMPTFRVDLG